MVGNYAHQSWVYLPLSASHLHPGLGPSLKARKVAYRWSRRQSIKWWKCGIRIFRKGWASQGLGRGLAKGNRWVKYAPDSVGLLPPTLMFLLPSSPPLNIFQFKIILSLKLSLKMHFTHYINLKEEKNYCPCGDKDDKDINRSRKGVLAHQESFCRKKIMGLLVVSILILGS